MPRIARVAAVDSPHHVRVGEIDAIRKSTLTGRPLGNDKFVENLESKMGRKMTDRPWGRPKKRSLSLI